MTTAKNEVLIDWGNLFLVGGNEQIFGWWKESPPSHWSVGKTLQTYHMQSYHHQGLSFLSLSYEDKEGHKKLISADENKTEGSR